MTETGASWSRVGRALLGRWPAQVATWGEQGIAAFVEELQADGLTPDQAVVGVRSYRPQAGRDFPPSVSTVSNLAHCDPTTPTPEEACTLIYGYRGVMKARVPAGGNYDSEAEMLGVRDAARLDRAWELHPLLGSFCERFGVRRLAMLEVDDPELGELRRRDVREAWGRHVTAMHGRDVAAIAAGRGRRPGLRQFDPLHSLRRPSAELGTGEVR